MLLKSKSFRRVFGSPGPMAFGTKGNEPHGHGTSTSSGEAGESRPSHGEHIQQDSHSRDESIEYLGTLRKELKRILPHIPDLTLLRWSGEKVRDPFSKFSQTVTGSNSDPTLESWSDFRLPLKLKSDGKNSCLVFVHSFISDIALFCSSVEENKPQEA